MSAVSTHLGMSKTARRYNVLVLSFALCAWLVTAALHLHVKDDHGDFSEPTPCTYCMVLSSGAAPAPEHRVPDIVVEPSTFVFADIDSAHGRAAPSFYLSRGPPRI